MGIDIEGARAFMATHARLLDRRRFELLDGRMDPSAVLAALDGYGNEDGGYGWGLEPDLRSPESQPGAAHHAFEVFEEIGPANAPQAVALCNWLESVSLPDGGLPFALPSKLTAGSGPWWQDADPSTSSLQITSVATAMALRVAVQDPAVAAHPWLERATDYCISAIDDMGEPSAAYVLAFSVRFLDALHESRQSEADTLLERLGEHVPADGKVPVSGGAVEEALHALDFAPYPDRPARGLFSDDVISTDLDRVASGQQEDGGWTVDYLQISPAGSMDWRGYATVHAVDILRRNGRV